MELTIQNNSFEISVPKADKNGISIRNFKLQLYSVTNHRVHVYFNYKK